MAVSAHLGVYPPKESALERLFGTPRVLIGVVHLLPIPGSPHYRGAPMSEVLARAVADARAYVDGGLHGVIVENAWDVPFAKQDDLGPETPAAMAVATQAVREAIDRPVGVNVLANAASCSLAVAKAAGGSFVRSNQWVNAYVANEGLVEGAAAAATRYRSRISGDELAVFADVHVKHGSHAIVADRSLEEQTQDAEFFDADVLIATGNRTGGATEEDEITTIRDAATLPVIVGSGMTEDNAARLMSLCDGAIVASSLKENGRWWGAVDRDRVRAFAARAEKVGYELP